MLFSYLNFIFDSGSGSLFSGSSFSGSSFSVQPAFGRARTLDGSLTNLSKPRAWKPLGEFSNPESGDNFEIYGKRNVPQIMFRCHQLLGFSTGSPISWNFENKRNTVFVLLLVCLYSLSVISGWVRVILSAFYRETSKNCSKLPRPTQKSHSMNKDTQGAGQIKYFFYF